MDCMSEMSGIVSSVEGGRKVVDAEPELEPVFEERDEVDLMVLIEPEGEPDCERSEILTNRSSASLIRQRVSSRVIV
jgi:hypothetical protein